MAGAPRCCYRLAMAHEYLYIARRANVAQALLLAASALLPTLAASGPRKRRVETRSEEHTSELQSLRHLVCRLLLAKKNTHKPRSRCVCASPSQGGSPVSRLCI